MQLATLAGRNAAGRTGDGRQLLGCELFPSHSNRVRYHAVAKLLNFEHYLHWPLAARKSAFFSKSQKFELVVQNNVEQRIVYVDLAIVLNEAQFPKFVHEKINARPRCPDHLRQHLLRYFGKRLLKITGLSIPREQQESARQSFLAGVEKLIDQVLFHPDVSCQHV